MTANILLLILVGLAYIGAVQVYRVVRGRCERIATRWRQVRAVLEHLDKGRAVIEIKPKPKTTPAATRAETVVEEAKPLPPAKPQAVPQEQEVIVTLEVEPALGEYSLSEAVTADELEQMGRTLSIHTASGEEEFATAKTIAKLKDSPMMDALIGATGDRIKTLFSNVFANDPKIVKEGYDYAKFITK